MATRLDNYYIYMHLDKEDISIMGLPWHNEYMIEHIPVLAQSIANSLTSGIVFAYHTNGNETGYQRMLMIEYFSGRITIRYDKVFRGKPDFSKDVLFKKYIMASVVIENYHKLDCSSHHRVCLLIDLLLEQHWTTRDFHIRRCEIAADTLDKEAGTYIAQAMVPHRACLDGWECKNIDGQPIKRKAWVPFHDGQYYWGSKKDESKDRQYRRREWNPHIHWYGNVPIWRIELRLSSKYLYDEGIRKHRDLLDRMEGLFTHNVKFLRPDLESIRKFLFKCRQSRKYPEFIKKAWNSYLMWEQYSTCAWMLDLSERIGKQSGRFFKEVDYPVILLDGHMGSTDVRAQEDWLYGTEYYSKGTC